MKFSIAFIVASAAFISQTLATPAPQTTAIFHCRGPYDLKCPVGYRCCGPIIEGVGGTCFLGVTGICPL